MDAQRRRLLAWHGLWLFIGGPWRLVLRPGATSPLRRVASPYEKDFRRYIRGRVARRSVRSDLGAPGIRGAWWQPAAQGASYSNQTWRLWSFPWQAKSPGKHTITVRATDNTGAVQTADRVGSDPDGATGWHTVDFTVAER